MKEKSSVVAQLKERARTTSEELATAFRAGGFNVEIVANKPDTDWARLILNITSPKLSEREFERTVTISLEAPRYSSQGPTEVVVTYRRSQMYGARRPRRYTVLSGIAAKLLPELQNSLESAIKSKATSDATEAQLALLEAKKATELTGVVLPPGTKVDVIGGNGRGNGLYRLSFDSYDSILSANLTPAQVRAVADLLNEIQGTSRLMALRAAWASKTYFWTNSGDWISLESPSRLNFGLRPAAYTQDKAQEMLATAKAKLDPEAVVEVVPFSTFSRL